MLLKKVKNYVRTFSKAKRQNCLCNIPKYLYRPNGNKTIEKQIVIYIAKKLSYM